MGEIRLEHDVVFAELPAEADLAAFVHGGEVDQAEVVVFEFDADLLEPAAT